MSVPGIRSNRGDSYQTLVALGWALSVIIDPDKQWIEVDSVLYRVDDVVVGKSEGFVICCQCKKNQPDFDSWKMPDLKGELEKATSLLEQNQKAQVRFISRTPFGAIDKLREFFKTQPDGKNYLENLTKDHQKTDSYLQAILAVQAPRLSTYEFLKRIRFDVTPDMDRMEAEQQERLSLMTCNHEAVYDALWRRIDRLGARMDSSDPSISTQHRLTKEDLVSIIQRAGGILASRMDLSQVQKEIAATSSIGRAWQQDIAGQKIENPVVNELLESINSENRAILLTGYPGSGKTCVMLELMETLEEKTAQHEDIIPLFIQSREFADLVTAGDRQSQGLPENWVEQVARLAENVRVVVIIDSLDVLSISREHSVLRYFLAQIDRLLLLQNITVVTACRDFDRKYDRHIAQRNWDCELRCTPFNWDTQVEPLLRDLNINTDVIDDVTRELIRNPRELALFVELALDSGSFSIVTSQELAQKYLNTFVLDKNTLGEAAMKEIEAIANEMLQSRSLAIPIQRFNTSQEILKELCSLNVLQKTQDGKLTFGHQTLLDVLVISRALRNRSTLNNFIQDLPPVPFVRPSIRSFVAQLALFDRDEFRKQLRTVLTGNAAYHIRRLVAESFAEQKPLDADWPLIRSLYCEHREIFQIIYHRATSIEWHHFWFEFLVPVLLDEQDNDGLATHIHQVSPWINKDTEQIIGFWTEALSLGWFESRRIDDHLGLYISKINSKNLPIAIPLLEQLLDTPRQEHSFLGCAVAHCISTGVADDTLLWKYVAGDVSDDDIFKYKLDHKLHCDPHEFGDKAEKFFPNRIKESVDLLNLALNSIESWSHLKSSRYGEGRRFHNEFMIYTSHENAHSQTETRPVDSLVVLLDALEAAILKHAENNTEWWQINRDRVCFNQECAIRYFGVLACISTPKINIDLIGRMLCDKELWGHQLSYELGSLIKVSFIYLEEQCQNIVMSLIETMWEEEEEKADGNHLNWISGNRAKNIAAIPCHLRSTKAQILLDAYEMKEGPLIRQPSIWSRDGTVTAPFSYEVFLKSSNEEVLRVLGHYAGHRRDRSEFLVGGESEVGQELKEASSRSPMRFVKLLKDHWLGFSVTFRNDMLSGISNFLRYRFGNHKPSGEWSPVDEPDAQELAIYILDELERHPIHWHLNDAASEALKACANVIEDTENAGRLVFMAIGFATANQEIEIKGGSDKLINQGINMMGGHVAEALINLANQLIKRNIPFPELLPPTLRRFAMHEHPAIRALILRRLPYLQSQNHDLGWALFHDAMKVTKGLWKIAERCLYYAYHNHFQVVAPLLERIPIEGNCKDMETWGRISALAALSDRIEFTELLGKLKLYQVPEAWKGAASVWTHIENARQHRDQCFLGIETGFEIGSPYAEIIAKKMDNLFEGEKSALSIPIGLIQRYFDVLENDPEKKHRHPFRFEDWLNLLSLRDPDLALNATETFLEYAKKANLHLFDHNNSLTQLVTRLFAEAEEREESDGGEMLWRVVAIQDSILALGLSSFEDWLRAAERP